MPISRSSDSVVLITMGDPSGVGPEVIVKALADPAVSGRAPYLVIGDESVMRGALRLLKGAGPRLNVIDDLKAGPVKNRALNLLDLANSPYPFRFGKADVACGRCALEYIDEALRILKARRARALVTAPVNKSLIDKVSAAGFVGHTEYLAKATASKRFAMMFVGERLKVTLVTRHIPLKKVASTLNEGLIAEAIELTHECLVKRFKTPRPRIGVAGLNPHAGESGILGDEEEMIRRAMKRLAKRIRGLCGPRPPDTVFYEALNGWYDAVVAMYHDQGLAPFKTLYFDRGVNVTLGLPFVRTSPDHGTALDIAGKGIARPDSMKEAIRLAADLA